ncbi:hypothetical protein KOI91_24280 [Escherichia coli]|uniref:hypothetical protein n=1 Tax=Escherichia coli TaxID=562 RepID=UPI001CA3DC9D|nr:hypothetical protein [Escherichia coli]MBY8790167.1 hypothetical protein [Escherichia coli]
MSHKYISNIIFKIFALAIILIAVYASWYPVFHHAAWAGHDYLVHMNRALSTIDSLGNGQFPPLYDINYKFHPGYSNNLFYPPIANVITSAALFFTSNFNLTVKFIAILSMLLSTLTTYFVLMQFRRDKLPSIIYAVCFSSSIYMIDNIFVRTSYPEAFAICAIPLFVYGLYADTKKNQLFFLVTANTILILTNIPATLCSGVIFVIYWFIKRDNLFVYCVSAVVSILISMWYVAPLLYSIHGESFTIIDRNWFPVMVSKAISLYDLISGEKIKSGTLSGMALGIGWPIFISFLYTIFKQNNEDSNKGMIYIMLVITFIICSGFNYTILPDVFNPLSKIQFSWRFTPYLLFFIILYIYKSNKLNINYSLAILLATSLMTTAITIPKSSSKNIISSEIHDVSFKDYVLKGAKELKSNKSVLDCNIGNLKITLPYSVSINDSGMPTYTINAVDNATCQIPFMAYKSLQLIGVKEYHRDGYFLAALEKGVNVVNIVRNKTFNIILFTSFLTSLISIILFTSFIKRK